MDRNMSEIIILNDGKKKGGNSKLEEKEPHFEEIYNIKLYRGKHPRFIQETYVVEFRSKLAGNYTYRYLIHELSRKTNSLAFNAAYSDLEVSSIITTEMLKQMIARANRMKLDAIFEQVDNLSILLGEVCNYSDAEEYLKNFEEYILENLEGAPLQSKDDLKFKEYGFLILDKESSIEKYGAVTVAASKDLLMDLFLETSEENSKNTIDSRLKLITKGWIATGICISRDKVRDQETIPKLKGMAEKHLRMYVINCPKVNARLIENGAL
ncbi:hypothetical protein H1230_25175 [Paenibacillus sp. 19GGS1-52]|uniref:hypothetical protein n=1 Tax=Paenibacillus sp. 19GGS1-52 TaxID=2758563 RepID=UPI001EFAE1F0|nr:hypothetical protein [Paenibacillus sp. 19GGS1-52]ULO06282.1 hypothetical protein H1230_25175 [Paenibacillus sp. 19GGS1-52]